MSWSGIAILLSVVHFASTKPALKGFMGLPVKMCTPRMGGRFRRVD